MRSRLTILLTVLAAALALPSAASAATTFGDGCVADDNTGPPANFIVFNIAGPDNPLPVAAPSDGVITSWTVRQTAFPQPIPLSLRVIRPAPLLRVQLVAEAPGTVEGATTSFPARIPVKAGDMIGLAAAEDANLPLCLDSGPAMFTVGGHPNTPPVPVGALFEPEVFEEAIFHVPVSATLEPDADGDGFGDETQDKCPGNASIQAECPVPVVVAPTPPGAPIVLDSLALPRKGKVLVYVAGSAAVPVTVSGSAKLPRRAAKRKKRPSGKRRARAAAKRRTRAAARVKLRAVTKAVSPGRLTRFAIPLPGRVKRELRRGGKVRVELTASATDSAGRPASDATKLRLRGTAKRRPRHKR